MVSRFLQRRRRGTAQKLPGASIEGAASLVGFRFVAKEQRLQTLQTQVHQAQGGFRQSLPVPYTQSRYKLTRRDPRQVRRRSQSYTQVSWQGYSHTPRDWHPEPDPPPRPRILLFNVNSIIEACIEDQNTLLQRTHRNLNPGPVARETRSIHCAPDPLLKDHSTKQQARLKRGRSIMPCVVTLERQFPEVGGGRFQAVGCTGPGLESLPAGCGGWRPGPPPQLSGTDPNQ